MIDTRDWVSIHCEERYGGNSAIKGLEIRVKLTTEAAEAIKERWNGDAAADSVVKDVSHVLHDVEKMLWRGIEAAFAKRDPRVRELANQRRIDFTSSFHEAGLDPIFMEAAPNEYHGKDDPYYSLASPWFIVTTRLGRFKVGWRKRVIELNWSGTTVEKTASELFPNVDVTKGDLYIDAWSYADLTSYLKVIGGSA